MDARSQSSNSDVEKTYLEKTLGQPRLREREEDILAACQPPFTAYGNSEKDPSLESGEADGAALTNVDSKPSVNNIRLVPNGGTKAWLQVLGTFFVFFNTWGIVNAVSLRP